MKKERFVAFFDAIMAIIMTIIVLEFALPRGTSWGDLKELGLQVLVYALSFFWLGMMRGLQFRQTQGRDHDQPQGTQTAEVLALPGGKVGGIPLGGIQDAACVLYDAAE